MGTLSAFRSRPSAIGGSLVASDYQPTREKKKMPAAVNGAENLDGEI